MEEKFYRCEVCGQIVEAVKKTPVPMFCCGSPMTELKAGTTDASQEKHVPKYIVENNVCKVSVGEVEHPMTAEHFIEWVSIETNKGVQRKKLSPEMKPYAEFLLSDGEQIEQVYAYCNLHSLWKA